jgi:hypothetical protein
MTNPETLKSHIKELKRKHRNLDDEIGELEKHYNVMDEIRRLKTAKLWYKDEIYRLENQLYQMENGLNGR